MNRGYSIDLKKFGIEKLRELLRTRKLLSGHQTLKDDLDKNFDLLVENKIENLQGLNNALKAKQKLESFAKKSGISVDYLTILKRHSNSFVSKAVKLSEFPEVDTVLVKKLETIGVKNSKILFDRTSTDKEIEELAKKANIEIDKLTEIVKLSNLVRIWGVGPIFARILYKTGYETIEEFASTESKKSYPKVHKTNKEGKYTTTFCSEDDLEFCVFFAKLIVEEEK